MSTKVPESDAVGSSGAENVSQRGVEPLQTVIMQANSVASSNQQTDDISVPHDSSNRKTILSTNHEKHADPSKHYDSSEGTKNLNDSDSQGESKNPITTNEVPLQVPNQTIGQVDFNQDGFNTEARVANDGRVNIKINQKSRRLSELLVPALRSQLKIHHEDEQDPTSAYVQSAFGSQAGQMPPPPMNIVIHVVGSRGDVQPFIALGKFLKETYSHRVRLATHPTFKGFVEENGLEFFSIGGDPAELMAYMVKNPGLMPGIDSLRSGDIGKRRKSMYQMFEGCWRSCIELGDGSGIRASDDTLNNRSSFDSGIVMDGDSSAKPFVADAIIANPPSFAHIHCAEKLGIPLHLMFTMPWSPTQAFPHPLTNIQSSNADASITNFVSYALVEMMTWQGLGDVINRFREDLLGLEPVSLMWAPGMASRLRIPYTYCWSPALIPKPKDWGPHISISGFYFLSLASSFTPEPELASFLESGEPPIYIGFGSIVVDDPNGMTKLIFEAVKKTGHRALVSKGWGGFGGDTLNVPDGIFMLGNVPHDWLFKHVSCVVHHGGAGTTAAGIAMGKPTVVVPFFGDQPFWGAMVARAGAGPVPVPSKHLTSDNLAAAILEALKPTALERANQLGASIKSEKGTQVGAQSFHDKLDISKLRCAVAPTRAAAWRVKRTNIRLSPFAATTLGQEGLLSFSDLKLYRPMEYDSEDGPWDPITGGASALLGTLGSLAMGFVDFPVEIFKAMKTKPADVSVSKEGGHLVSKSNSPQDPLHASSDALLKDDKSNPTDPSTKPPATSGNLSSEGKEYAKTQASEPQTPHGHRHTIGNGQDRAESPLGFLHRNSTSHTQRVNSISKSSSQKDSDVDPASGHLHRSFSGDFQPGQISLDAALGAGKGIGRIVGAGLKSPMDFTLSLARGFHNAPKLYGDESVRQADKITGIQSGLKAAGKEFGLGLYDGISGLITQPIEGAKKEGVAGLIKGFGKGIGGVVLKPNAAIWGIPGYTFMGVYKELQKHFGSSTQNYIIAARTTQGFEDWKASSQEDRLDVVARWHSVKIEINKERQQEHENSHRTPHGFLRNRHLSLDDRRKAAKDKKAQKKEEDSRIKAEAHGVAMGNLPLRHAQTFPTSAITTSDHAAFEEAIQSSIAATSQGDTEQDKMIERAIRASVLELQSASKEGADHEALQRAIQASIDEATRARKEKNLHTTSETPHGVDDHEDQLKAALHESIKMHESANLEGAQHPTSTYDFDDSGIDTEDDENFKAAIENSKTQS